MKFKVERHEHPNLPKYPTDEFSLAKRFAEALKDEMPDLVKAAVLFGSSARHPGVLEHDIDVLLIIDDLTLKLTPEVIEAYRVITEHTAAKVSKRLHITAMKISSFWEYVRNGDPVVINVLRDGIPLYDVGFFEPVQFLLRRGRIRPTRESIHTYMARAPIALQHSRDMLLQATMGLYWACIDAAHAALMSHGEVPQTPQHVPDMLDETFVKQKKLEAKSVTVLRHLFDVSKMIEHHEIFSVGGEEYARYAQQAKEFVDRMQRLVR